MCIVDKECTGVRYDGDGSCSFTSDDVSGSDFVDDILSTSTVWSSNGGSNIILDHISQFNCALHFSYKRMIPPNSS